MHRAAWWGATPRRLLLSAVCRALCGNSSHNDRIAAADKLCPVAIVFVLAKHDHLHPWGPAWRKAVRCVCCCPFITASVRGNATRAPSCQWLLADCRARAHGCGLGQIWADGADGASVGSCCMGSARVWIAKGPVRSALGGCGSTTTPRAAAHRKGVLCVLLSGRCTRCTQADEPVASLAAVLAVCVTACVRRDCVRVFQIQI